MCLDWQLTCSHLVLVSHRYGWRCLWILITPLFCCHRETPGRPASSRLQTRRMTSQEWERRGNCVSVHVVCVRRVVFWCWRTLWETTVISSLSVLEMLSYSKFSDLETWLCMPSSLLLPRSLDSTRTSSASSSSSHGSNHSSPPISSSSSPASNSRRSTCSEPGETGSPLR